MTRSEPPTSVTGTRAGDKRFTRDVAKQLDRRRMRRRMTIWSALLALIVAAAGYLRCGSGFGVGTGTGTGTDTETSSTPTRPLAGPRRCSIRVAPAGITVDGKPMSRDAAVDACKATDGADVIITGDARQGNWQELKAALIAAGIKDISETKPTPPDAGSS